MRSLMLMALFLPSALLADRIVPASAHAAGRNGAFFQTDLRLLNTSPTETATAVLTFLPASGAIVVSPEIRIPPRQQVAFDDVLATLFDVRVDSSGPIRVSAPEAVEVTSRTYSTVDPCTAGTFGTFLPGLSPSSALTSGLIPQAAGSADATSGSRTNLVLVNPSATEAAAVRVSLLGGDGARLGSEATVNVNANGSTQADVFALVGASAQTTTNAFVAFTSDRPVLALTTVIDNRTNDSSAYPAVPAAAPATLVNVGDQTTFSGSYGVSGKAAVSGIGALRVTDFRSSGTAPGLDLRVGRSGRPRKEFTVLRVLGRQSFGGATLDLPLPSSLDLNGFDTFTVWCYEFDVVIAEGTFRKP